MKDKIHKVLHRYLIFITIYQVHSTDYSITFVYSSYLNTIYINAILTGALTGLDKAETAAKHGEEQVQIWRRSFDTPPPPMEPEHPYFDTIAKDPRYAQEPQGKEFPMYESLKLTIDRTLPYWNSKIVPQIKEGKKILIAAHGNSLRGIVKHLDNLSDEDIMLLNLPTGIPFVYELDENMKPIKSMQFLGDEETVKKAIESVANQGKAFL